MSLIELCERGWIPDALIRRGIRHLCAKRLRQESDGGAAAVWARFRQRLDLLRASPLAIETEAANRQHYELPPRFFELCLGARLKYSSAYYARDDDTLDRAEEAMLALYLERADLADGQHILELGCGWGSLTLWLAERLPRSHITGVSNSLQQREYILAQARARGLGNIEILTCDVNRLTLESRFDRVVSIEMFEHLRNYRLLLRNISDWLQPDGQLFVHIFCHRELMYPFETQGEDDWMGRHFFTGGLMPAADTLLHFQEDLVLREQWRVPGTHYQKTANHWLANQDARRDEIMAVLTEAYGERDALRWQQRWRMFWMACAELFGYRSGSEWLIAHYRFARR
jgi:cyclopropane-fatty-acyl-phospholipid synthase